MCNHIRVSFTNHSAPSPIKENKLLNNEEYICNPFEGGYKEHKKYPATHVKFHKASATIIKSQAS